MQSSNPAISFTDACQRAQTLIDSHELDQSADACVRLVQTYPNKGDSWHLLSVTSLKLGRLALAVDSALKSLDTDSKNSVYWLQLSRCYIAAGDWQQARKALRVTDSCLQPAAAFLDTLGVLYYQCNELDMAITTYDRAIQIDPNYKPSYFNKATVLGFQGHGDDARKIYRQLLESEPGDYEACYNLVQLQRQLPNDNALDLLERALPLSQGNWRAEVQLGYGLGKIHEDLGNHKQAFHHYGYAAALKRQHINYSVESDVALMSELADFFRNNSIASHDKAALSRGDQSSPQPIFVIGLPRTGTTLVERILSSHPDVDSEGELNSLPISILEAGGKSADKGPAAIDAGLIAQLDSEKLSGLGQRYVQLTQSWIGQSGQPKAKYFVDKLPFNFLFCGFIRHALPHAKIIHVTRDPKDAGLSNYKMLFSNGYHYSYDLEELATYIRAYHKLMNNWHDLYPGSILSISYESLVSNQQRETKRLLEHCNLPWDERCLNFHQNQAACQTASAQQVRESIHSRSIGLWQHYEHQLSPLIDALNAQQNIETL